MTSIRKNYFLEVTVSKSWISGVTVTKRLYEGGLFTREPAVCILLPSGKRRVRLAWCRYHKKWITDQWKIVLCTDEYWFILTIDFPRLYRENQGLATCLPIPKKSTIILRRLDVLWWWCCMILHSFHAFVTCMMDKGWDFRTLSFPFHRCSWSKFLFYGWLVNSLVSSPDLNLIDSILWSLFEKLWVRAIAISIYLLRTIQGLKLALLKEWDQFP